VLQNKPGKKAPVQQSWLHGDFGTVSMVNSRVNVFSQEEQNSRAEILQLLGLVKHDQSFSSWYTRFGLHSVICAKWNDLPVGAPKASHSISHGTVSW